MCAPLARNHAFFFEKCVPLLHETILFCKNTESRTRGYVNNSRNLPTSRTQRTQGRNIPVQGNPLTPIYIYIYIYIASQSSPKAPPAPPTGSPRPSPSYAALWGGVRGGSGLVLTVKTCGFRTIWNSVTEPGGATEVVSRPATRTPHPTRTGGQDDGNYTNYLK